MVIDLSNLPRFARSFVGDLLSLSVANRNETVAYKLNEALFHLFNLSLEVRVDYSVIADRHYARLYVSVHSRPSINKIIDTITPEVLASLTRLEEIRHSLKDHVTYSVIYCNFEPVSIVPYWNSNESADSPSEVMIGSLANSFNDEVLTILGTLFDHVARPTRAMATELLMRPQLRHKRR